jgi:hypothetical protein
MRRREDGIPWWRILIRENAYRDAWLVLLSIILVWASFASVDASRKAEEATQGIQIERRDATLRACQDQNDRHDATFAQLDKLSARDLEQAQTPEQKLRAQQTIAGTKALVDALAPKRNCADVVEATVGNEVPEAG